MDEPESESPASILASVRVQEAQFELLSRALEKERRHVTAQLDRVWVTPQEPPLTNGSLTHHQQDGKPFLYTPTSMEAYSVHANERYVIDDDSSYKSCTLTDETRGNEIPIQTVVGYSQTLDRPYREAAGGGGAYTTVPRNYHYRGPRVDSAMPLISQSPHPGYSSLSRPNQQYHSGDPFRGPGYGPQPQVRCGGLGSSQSDLLLGRLYGSEDVYGLEDDRRSLGGFIDGPDYASTGRRVANGGDPRRRLR
ncbi:hypothetical protein XELAEV_18037256mg [Xenopus laevis]|uniref:Uncharacterized protein n=1 Tax=Xenopus laevis TaxID=8355 RepID=A0A974CBZ8_XENLA|nr:hypothetical protein XELAEV_18037256mg [Xenopus laevis]